jgi:phenylpropionate dioxygenase-like ring-hydroxylating dioxygenase large terminal subunit
MLMDDATIAQRILDHIDNKTTDLSDQTWREPVANYRSEERLQREIALLRRLPIPFCPSAALRETGAYLARDAAGVPLIAVRGGDGVARVFRNACRHRGAQLACGQGRENAFVCPYHGWAYGLDGTLRNIPHDYGFPDVDKKTHGLVPVHAVERGGLIFVTQEGDDTEPTVPDDVLPADLELVSVSEQETATNWKVSAEGFLEGYHIYATHRETFFPVQFDNLNVIEYFGRNSRVCFPYRNIQKLRNVPPAERHVAGTLTYVYHFFPNAIVATFPQRIIFNVLEPVSLGVTRNINYTLATKAKVRDERQAVDRDTDFVNAGTREDRAVVESIQRGLASNANEYFEYGRFEGAIVHFHKHLHALMGD